MTSCESAGRSRQTARGLWGSAVGIAAALTVVAMAVGHPAMAQPRGLSNMALEVSSSDPAEHTDTSGLCVWNIACGEMYGRLEWSPDGPSCWNDARASMPLVIVLHGNGFDPYDYTYLQDHLARNGFFTASLLATVNPYGTVGFQAAAEKVEDFLESSCFDGFLGSFSVPQAVDFHNIGLVGHSRGGEVVRYLAHNLYLNPSFTTRAVVAMAPTHKTSTYLLGHETRASMTFGASQDEDVSIYGVFKAHDQAGLNEYSTPSYLDLDRGMKLFFNGVHGGFTDSPLLPAPPQAATAKGYVHAFLRAWQRDDWSFYSSYIRGDAVPGPWGLDVTSQYSSGAARKVVDNFEDLTASSNTLGGGVDSFGMGLLAVADGEDLSTTPHSARGLHLRPTVDYAYVRWSIPTGQRNFSSYRFVSLRLGQLTGIRPAEARLWIRNAGSLSWVDLDDFGGLPGPREFCIESDNLGNCVVFADQGHMRTIRVRTDTLGGVNQVDRIYLQLRRGAVGEDFLIDNLEFSGNVFDF